jgi:hypothetical protein
VASTAKPDTARSVAVRNFDRKLEVVVANPVSPPYLLPLFVPDHQRKNLSTRPGFSSARWPVRRA